MLMDLLNRYGGQSTDVTAGQRDAIGNLTSAASGIPNFGASSSDAIKNLFSSSTTPQVGMLNDAFTRLRTNLDPTARGENLDPYSTPGFSDAIARMTRDITNNTKAVYAGSGRDPSGAGSFAGSLGRGLTEGIAPVIANQYNTNAARMDSANNTLFGGAGSTASGVTGLNQIPLTNAAGAVGLLPGAASAYTVPGTTQLGAENTAFQQPWTNLAALLGPLAGIAGLGSQSTGQGTSDTTQQHSVLSNIIGGATGAAGIASLLRSDKRAKEEISSIGMLNDGQEVVRFRYKGSPTMRIGLLAQDVADFEPDAVYNVGGMLSVDHRKATDRAAEIGRAT